MPASRLLRPLRCSLTKASVLLLMAASAACGRTEALELLGEAGVSADAEIDATRELTLADARVVYVELLSPAPVRARDNLMTAQDGIELQVLVDQLVPEGKASVEIDNNGDLPVVRVLSGEDVRALIWI